MEQGEGRALSVKEGTETKKSATKEDKLCSKGEIKLRFVRRNNGSG